MKQKRMRCARGFTLFEALVVIALIGLFVAFGIPALLQMLQNYYVSSATTQLAVHIRFARNECISRKIDYRVVVRSTTSATSPNSYQVEYDPDQDGTFEAVPDMDVDLTRGVEILNTSLFSGGTATITFNTRGGASSSGSPPYNMELQSTPTGTTYRIRVNLTGSVEIEKV